MPSLFHRTHLALTLLLLSGVSLLVARDVNLLVEWWLEPLATASLQPTAKPAPSLEPLPLVLGPLARVLGLPDKLRERVIPATPEGNEPVPNTLGLRLLGTLLGEPTFTSFAAVSESPSQRSHSVWMGSTLHGAQVVAIERTRVLVLNAGRLESIGPGEDVDPRARQPAQPSAPHPLVRQVGPNQYELSRQQVNDSLAHLEELSMQVRVVPAFSNGEARGFKLFSIRPNSLFAQLGLSNGDVLRRINGLSLDSAERVLELYTRLREAPRIEMEVERAGQVVHQTYTIQN